MDHESLDLSKCLRALRDLLKKRGVGDHEPVECRFVIDRERKSLPVNDPVGVIAFLKRSTDREVTLVRRGKKICTVRRLYGPEAFQVIPAEVPVQA